MLRESNLKYDRKDCSACPFYDRNGWQVTRKLIIIFFGSGALDRSIVFGHEEHDRSIAIVDHDHTCPGLEDGARDNEQGCSRFLRSFLGARALLMTMLLITAKCEEYAEPAGVVAALRS